MLQGFGCCFKRHISYHYLPSFFTVAVIVVVVVIEVLVGKAFVFVVEVAVGTIVVVVVLEVVVSRIRVVVVVVVVVVGTVVIVVFEGDESLAGVAIIGLPVLKIFVLVEVLMVAFVMILDLLESIDQLRY